MQLRLTNAHTTALIAQQVQSEMHPNQLACAGWHMGCLSTQGMTVRSK